jgi:hypothetical protein
VLEQADPGGGGGHALLQHALAEQGVDERALARVELADHHEEEQLVELAERAQEGVLVVSLHVEPGQHRSQVGQELALLREQGLLAPGEDPLLHVRAPKRLGEPPARRLRCAHPIRRRGRRGPRPA